MNASPLVDQPPLGPRVLFGVVGVIATVGGAVITLGGSLAGMIAIVFTALVMRRTGRRMTRVGAWVASVAGAILLAVLLLGGSALIGSNEVTKPLSPQELEASRARARASMPAWLRDRAPQNAAQQAAADSMAAQLMQKKGAMVWVAAMAAMVGSSMLGLFAGTIGWGSAMLLYRASRGRWLRSPATIGSVPVAGATIVDEPA